MATKTKVLRVSIYLKRKEGLSVEEFNRYWSEVHGPLVRPLIQKYGILKYTQVSEQHGHWFSSLRIYSSTTQVPCCNEQLSMHILTLNR